MQQIQTLTDIYAVTCDIARPVVMKSKKGDRWVDVSLDEFRDTVRWFSTGLRLLGVKAGDRVGILSENQPEWTIADFGILCAAGITVPVYPTLLGWQIEYILNDAGCVAVVASNEEQMNKLLEVRSHCPHLEQLVQHHRLRSAERDAAARRADVPAARRKRTRRRAQVGPRAIR